MSATKLSIGDFSVFGFTKEPSSLSTQRMLSCLGITPKTIEFGEVGHLFFYSSYGEVAESDNLLVMKLGFIRTPSGSSISAKQLITNKIVGTDFIDHEAIRGNALIVVFSKIKPIFSAFKTILGVPQLYYSAVNGGIFCSDRLRCIVNLLDRVDLNEDAVPLHFLFRETPGELTYFKQIKRMIPGESIKWYDGKFDHKLAQTFNFYAGEYPFLLSDQNAKEALYDSLKCVVGNYVTQIETSGNHLINLLSGGVDSSLIQFLINLKTSHMPPCSCSYAIHVPSFKFEIEYARKSIEIFQTQHQFIDIKPENYPGLLTRAIEILAQPPILETEPSMLSLAEFFQNTNDQSRYFSSGQGADTVFGLTKSKKLKGLYTIGRIPFASPILKTLGIITKPFTRISQALHKGSLILRHTEDSDSFISPDNQIAVYSDLNLLRRCFGEETLLKSLQYRREFSLQYIDSKYPLERMHLIDLLSDTYEIGVQRQQLFLSCKREQIHPFFDDDVLRIGFAFHPEIRYIKSFDPKYLLKDLLAQKTSFPYARKRKGFSIFEEDLFIWMKSGPLRPLVQEIEKPGFLTRPQFDRLLNQPDYTLWTLLTFDLFKKRIIGNLN
ncbi:MAG: asparagine synthase-related protein [Anaerolineaceae bacterium]|nr:asparagine synthase-related protein [Anaerolineaceae bacterium]